MWCGSSDRHAGCRYPTGARVQFVSSLSWKTDQVGSEREMDYWNQTLAFLNSSSQKKQFKFKGTLYPSLSKKAAVFKKGVNGE